MNRIFLSVASLFFALVLVSTAVFADSPVPDASLVHTAGIPNAVVDGVNVMTGDYMEARRDMTIDGAFPLHLDSFYNSSNFYFDSLLVAWRHNHQGIGYLSIDSTEWIGDGCQVIYREPSGSTIRYVAKYPKKGKHDLEVKLNLWMDQNVGLTNCYGQIGGHTNYKNNIFVFSKSKRHLKSISGTTCSGSKLTLEFIDGHKDHELHEGRWSKRFRPVCEAHPDGHQIHYSYDDTVSKERVTKITTTDRNQQPLNSFTFNYETMDKSPAIQVESSDGRTTKYSFTNLPNGPENSAPYWLLTEKVRSDGPTETYSYEKSDAIMPLLSACNLPDGRYKQIEYYKKKPKEERTANRVHILKAPVGADSTPIITKTFEYTYTKDGGGVTNVRDALGRLTKYYYTKDFQLTAIARMVGHFPHSIEKLLWGAKNSPNATNLLARNIHDHNDGLILSHSYTYDNKGNIQMETLGGNLTGIIDNPYNLEKYQKTYTYSDDDYHLVTSETDGTKKTLFRYQPNSSRLAARFTCENSQIRKREFFTYNHQEILIQTITDDGTTQDSNDLTNVTQRQIVTVIPTHTGLPETIETKYLDPNTRQEILLNKVVNHYSPHSKLIQQDHYDSTNELAYTLQWQYDTHGNITMQQDALGNTVHRTYDDNNNLILQEGPRNDQTKKFTYDLMNRLIVEEEISDTHLITRHQYDLVGNRTSTTDPYNQTTYYTYNELNQLIRIQHPSTNSNETPIETFTYDTLGFLSSKTDPQGNKTQTSSTIRGKPYRILYPDGTTEISTYTPSGLLHTHTSRANITTTYSYDYQNRITQETTSSPHETLKTTTHTYNAFHLLSTTDPSGITTYYTYDPAGRLSTTTREGRATTITYDALSRKHKEITTENSIVYLYDPGDQLIEEQLQDPSGNILTATTYRYDANGNRTHIIRNTSAGQSIDQTTYNCQHHPTTITDPLGNQTHITYDHTHLNKHNQTVLKVITTDPLGQQTHITFNTHHKEALLEKYLHGELLSREEYHYNSLDQLIRTTHINISQEECRIITHSWEYNNMGQLTRQIEALGTPEQKITYHQYNNFGQKSSTTKPDGIILHYTYDPLGRLETLTSSDNTISYHYNYNPLDLPITIQDRISQTTTTRQYNAHGEITQEQLANNLTLSYSYDNLGRITAITLPDKTTIDYQYDALYLRQISYKKLTHQYTEYDPSGNLLSSQTPAGTISYKRDLLNRPTHIQAPHFSQTHITYDPIGNLISYNENGSSNFYTTTNTSTFTYDSLYQLQSEAGKETHQYTHDSLHNRRTKDSIAHEINALNQLQSQGETQYTYNPCGNLIKIINPQETITCTYDALDRLLTYTKNNKTIRYTYDSFNRRLTKDDTSYLYADQKEIGSYTHNELQELRILGSGLGAEIGASVALYLNKQWYIPIHDHNGSIIRLLHPNGKLFESYSYTAFGEELFSNSINPWRFSSKRKDPDTHWIAFGRRDYDPTIGRWVTPDPQGFEDGPNLYAYVHNNPLTHIDPLGLLGIISVPSATTREFLQDCHTLGSKIWSDPRFQGGMQVAGGFLEVSAGSAALVKCPPLAGLLMMHGCDNIATGIKSAFTNTFQDTHTSQMLQSVGMSSQSANLAESFLSTTAWMRTASIGKIGSAYAFEKIATDACQNRNVGLLRTILPKSRASGEITFKSFTARNFRENLARLTGKHPSGYDAHHIFPQKYIDKFSKQGINIHNPNYGVWWETLDHQKRAWEYNQKWDTFFGDIPNPTIKNIIEYSEMLMSEYKK